jgi:hypothetical protein
MNIYVKSRHINTLSIILYAYHINNILITNYNPILYINKLGLYINKILFINISFIYIGKKLFFIQLDKILKFYFSFIIWIFSNNNNI